MFWNEPAVLLGRINNVCHLVFISFKLHINQIMSISVVQNTLLQLLFIASAFGSYFLNHFSYLELSTHLSCELSVLLSAGTEGISFLSMHTINNGCNKKHRGQVQSCREGEIKPWPCDQPNSLSLLQFCVRRHCHEADTLCLYWDGQVLFSSCG